MKNLKIRTLSLFVLVLTMGTFVDKGVAQTNQDQENSTAAVPIESVVILSPNNSRINFVGTHVGEDPKPRLGGFGEFSGFIKVDEDNQVLNSIVVDINVDSVWSEFADLTKHLKSAEFFDVEEYSRAKFVSTEIKTEKKGECLVVGNLTLHGETKRISFQAAYRFENDGLLFAAKFQLDRSQFGMDQMLGGVEKLVSLDIFVGQPTNIPDAKSGHGGNDQNKHSSRQIETNYQHVSINVPNMV